MKKKRKEHEIGVEKKICKFFLAKVEEKNKMAIFGDFRESEAIQSISGSCASFWINVPKLNLNSNLAKMAYGVHS